MRRSMAALIFGNANYANGGLLKNPVNDATDVAKKLESYGFHVIVATDATCKQMDKKLKEFKVLMANKDVALFFFAGHGMQIEGINYLLAVDTDTSDEDEAKHGSLSLNKVIETMEKSQAATKIIILDACRTNPWERAWNRTPAMRGLASVYAPKGTIIGFATSPGQVASDGKGSNGTYTEALLQHIDAPDCTIEAMFKRVRNTVAAETRGKQISWEHTSLSGDFFFNISLGQVIKIYRPTCLADSLFEINEAKLSHRIIKALKSRNWYAQNPALDKLNADVVQDMSNDSLFVVGRNVYQAACGDAKAAIGFVENFMEKTSNFPKEKRKALLDGMLFEIFFDPRAKLREKIKGNLFNEVFDLQEHATLRGSFDFISEALVASRGAFYVVPGKDHELAVTVATEQVEDGYRIDAIYVGVEDVLRPEDDEYAAGDKSVMRYSEHSASRLEEKLSQELVVPLRLLKITYTPKEARKGLLKFPLDHTIRKA